MKKFRLLLGLLSIFVTTNGFVPTQQPFWFNVPATWCTGANGALSVTDGSTVHIGHTIKDYSSITLTNGSQLVIDPGTGWVMICTGNLTINTGGAIVADNAELTFAGTLTATAPDGTSLSYTYTEVDGGAGGADGTGNSGGNGPGFPGGGGGGGGGVGNNSDLVNGGDGASGSCDGGGGGPGGLGPSGDGGNGCDAGPVGGGFEYGGGGGGGARGFHGASVYLKITGTASVSGVVFTSNGSNGGNGGGGGSGEDLTGSGFGGGGGGGGSGGSGGDEVIRYHLGSVTSGNVSVANGVGGSGGGGGTGICCGGSADGSPGNNGSDGNLGNIDIATF